MITFTRLAAVTCLLSVPQVTTRGDEIDLHTAAENWRIWHGTCRWRHLLATGYSWEENRANETASYFRSTPYHLLKTVYTDNGQSRTSISFGNGRYYAVVQQQANGGPYRLERFLGKNDPGFPQVARPTWLQNPVVLVDTKLWDVVGDPTRYRIVSQSSEVQGGDTLHHFHLRLTRGKPEEITDAKLVLSQKLDLLPIEMELTYAPKAGDMVVRVRWSEWQQVNGQWVWGQQHTEIVGKGPPRLVYDLDWDPPTKHSDDECWLSYYGLPEPAGSKWSLSLVLGCLSGGVLLLVVLLKALRRA